MRPWIKYHSAMKRLQAFKFQIKPNGEQVRALRQYAGNARKVWNLALIRQQEAHAAGEKFTNSFGMNSWLLAWKQDFPFFCASPSQTLQQVTKDLGSAYKNFFERRAAFPKFKKKGKSTDSFRFPQGFKLDQSNDRIFLPKLGWLRYRNSREVLGLAKNITVSSCGGKWFVSIQTEREVAQPLPTATAAIGIDVGIARFATLSDASFIAPLNSFKKHQKRLRRYQRAMSRKVKFSNNWKKAKARVQKLYTGIANARKDFLHKATTTISQNHALVCIEDLQVRNMSSSAKGDAENPGQNGRAKSGLNRAILDQGWGEFRRQLDYKLAWKGGTLLAVPAHNTSRTCPRCTHVSKDNRQTQTQFQCVVCGYKNHADVVGAINILERGHRLFACGEPVQSGRSLKQEPAKATHAAFA